MLMGGLFVNDNAEFFAQADANYAAGLTWQHIQGGCRAPDPNELYISAKNEDTGKEWVCFKIYLKQNQIKVKMKLTQMLLLCFSGFLS